jgi:polysaccharide deacetylase family protein (PEP-CTERM system associated)
MVTNALTIDTEDWFQVFYGSAAITRADWPNQESRIAAMVDRSLDMLSAAGVHATFFVVGWIADREPALVRRIAERGHEIGSHSFWHTEVFRQTPAELAEDLRQAKDALEQAIGAPVPGFRAPGYSIRREDEWALDVVLQAGHTYDSSLLHATDPVSEVRKGLLEVAPNALRFAGRCLPTNGGFFFRMTPYPLYRAYVSHLNRRGVPLVFYTHTWEIEVDYPRIPMPPVKRFVQYANLNAVRGKIERLISDHRFAPIAEMLRSR